MGVVGGLGLHSARRSGMDGDDKVVWEALFTLFYDSMFLRGLGFEDTGMK
jgi:hypothetical protein